MGFDARELTPLLVLRIVVTAAETRSFARAAIVMKHAVDQPVSAKTIERVVGDVGAELVARRDAGPGSDNALAQIPENPPPLAVVECDGGRIRARETDRGPGVHPSGDGWRETKNACLIRAAFSTFADDPQPEAPECFCDPNRVAKIVETQALSVASPLTPADVSAHEPEDASPLNSEQDWRPKRLVRTVLASMAGSTEFGKQMAREARRRRFHEAQAKAFLGDGLPWNWSIWKRHFSEFVPILDFIHAVSYLFAAAKAVHENDADIWSQYLAWMRGCWQGEIDQAIQELEVWREKLGPPPADAPEQDPRMILVATCRYLNNNRQRMLYSEYRRGGLPVTTAWMESLVKEMNYRVKGTEMFWNDPEGAEAILQVRAAALSDDDRLTNHLRSRVGCPFTRRPALPSSAKAPCRKSKS